MGSRLFSTWPHQDRKNITVCSAFLIYCGHFSLHNSRKISHISRFGRSFVNANLTDVYYCTCCAVCTIVSWASYQIRKIAGCACAGNDRSVSPRRQFQRKPLTSDPKNASRHVRDARAVMYVGIAYPRWRGKRSRHSRRMRTINFVYLARGPCITATYSYKQFRECGWLNRCYRGCATLPFPEKANMHREMCAMVGNIKWLFHALNVPFIPYSIHDV